MVWLEKQKLSPVVKPAITEELLKKYAKASGDPNPIHLDSDFA
ncbi:MAG: dehydratase, partial [Proteobacteria bacterium]|nr:dehydratase [Pseudomonadota bacterium]